MGYLKYSEVFGIYQSQVSFTYKALKGHNQYTALAKNASTPLKVGGTALGVVSYFATTDSWLNGEMTDFQYASEMTINTISTFGGEFGLACSVGWESGRLISKTSYWIESGRPRLQRGLEYIGINVPLAAKDQNYFNLYGH